MNLGLIRAIGAQAVPWQPLISNDGTTEPFPDTGVWGMYCIVPAKKGADIVLAWANFQWGGSGNAGNGTQYYFSLPTTARQAPESSSTDYFIGPGLYGQIFGTNDSPGNMFTVGSAVAGPNSHYAGKSAPAWCQMVIGHYTKGGTGSFSASTTKAQAHGLGAAPDAWSVTTQSTTTGVIAATADATNLNLTAVSSTSANYVWTATRTGGVVLGPTSPWAWGANQDHIEFAVAYPIGD